MVCELNNGQLVKYLRGELPQFDYLQYNKIQGLPFRVSDLSKEFVNVLEA
jgi:2-oxoglutarate ferredoxin oxidoreductase subunit alpha